LYLEVQPDQFQQISIKKNKNNSNAMVKLGGQEDYPIYFGAGPELLRIAGDLRKSMTPAERVLWERLRNKKIKGYRFRRQHPIKDFIVDFFCYDALLVVEVDGEVHNDPHQSERDEQRSIILKRLGIKELRFTNQQVINQTDEVINKIELSLSK
jgi:very-short-patch-repair endonuclease